MRTHQLLNVSAAKGKPVEKPRQKHYAQMYSFHTQSKSTSAVSGHLAQKTFRKSLLAQI